MTNASVPGFSYYTDEQGNTFIRTLSPVATVDADGTIVDAAPPPNQPRIQCGVAVHTHRTDRHKWLTAKDVLASAGTGFLLFCSAEFTYWICKTIGKGLLGLVN